MSRAFENQEGWKVDSHDVIKAMTATVGIKSIAARMGISASMLYKWTEKAEGPDTSGAPNPLDRLWDLMCASESNLPLEWLAEKADGVFVTNPPNDKPRHHDVIRSTQLILKEFSDLLDVVSRSLQDDGKIDAEEAARIRGEWEHFKRICEGFVRHCETEPEA